MVRYSIANLHQEETAMPFHEKGDVRIRYETVGSGFPLLVTPGGGLNSCVNKWPTAAALYRTDEMRGHMQRALDNGVTETELKGLITHVAFYAGWPCAVNAGRIAIEVFGPK
jgi:hypothetical protein